MCVRARGRVYLFFYSCQEIVNDDEHMNLSEVRGIWLLFPTKGIFRNSSTAADLPDGVALM